ncbi:MAG: T9SS type A sorting domain-containing protein [candidate division KSB1 bacterium]|nr:T9SS type A sorting domain-containing protein [candidate division KSB1 bacterium]
MKEPLLLFKAESLRGQIVGLLCCGAVLVFGLQTRAQTVFDLRQRVPDAVVQTPAVNTELGHAFAIGDPNADGMMDLVIGAPGLNEDYTPQDGAVYIFWGGKRLPGRVDFITNFPDVEIVGHPAGSGAGTALLCRDINGDWIDDLIIAAPYADPSGRIDAGVVEVIWGRKDFPGRINLQSQRPDVLIPGSATEHKLGRVLAAGDVNGDMIADLLLAAPGASTENGVASGVVYLIPGRKEWQATFSLLGDEVQVTRVPGKGPNNFLASSLAVGNFNGDEFADFLIGAHKANFMQRVDCGETYLILGRANLPEKFDLNYADRLFVGARDRDFSGWSVGGVDFDCDTVDEIIVGVPGANNASLRAAGQVHFFEFNGGKADTVDLSQSSGYFSISGPRPNSRIATNVLVADFNNDGMSDVLLGMPADSSAAGLATTGKLAVVYGRGGLAGELNLNTTFPDFAIIGDEAGSAIGSAFVAADFDGDGKTDIALKKNAGAAGNTFYLIYGTSLLTAVASDHKSAGGPETFALQPNFPNPFTGVTNLIIENSSPRTVEVVIYDLTGRRIRTLFSGSIPAGQTMLTWDGLSDTGQQAGAGLYFVRASAKIENKRMVRTVKVNLVF